MRWPTRRPSRASTVRDFPEPEAPSTAETDWRQILVLYKLLDRMAPNPMVTLNRAIATAMVHGPRAGLDLLAELDEDKRVAGHHRLDAVRAHLLDLAGEHEQVVELEPPLDGGAVPDRRPGRRQCRSGADNMGLAACRLRSVELRRAARYFGGVRAVDGLDLQVNEGEIVGLIGPNGSGKSTAVNVITGLFPLTSGEILFKGGSLEGLPTHKRLQLGIARTFPHVQLVARAALLPVVLDPVDRVALRVQHVVVGAQPFAVALGVGELVLPRGVQAAQPPGPARPARCRGRGSAPPMAPGR